MNAIKALAFFCAILSFTLASILRAQTFQNFDVKTNQLKKSGQHAQRERDYYSAIDFYEKYLERKPTDHKVLFEISEMYRLTRDYHRAGQYYKIAYEISPEKNLLALYYLGRMQMTQENYQEARETLNNFRKKYGNPGKGFNYRSSAGDLIKGCDMALQDTADNNKIYLTHLKNGVNMAYNESAPFPIGEDKMVFASLRSDTIIHYKDSLYKDTSSFRSSFYTARKERESWVYNSPFEGPFRFNDYDVSNGCFSTDGKRFYFTKCSKNWRFDIICNIYYTEFQDGVWQQAVILDENINSKKYSSTQVNVGVNPRNGAEILFFSSNRKDGKGGFDLWYTEMKNNAFGPARNLGGKINSEGDEITPFFDIESSTLYFSSNGHPGYGEMDVFKSFGNKSKWMKDPMNLGKGINSPADDLYYIYGKNPQSGFFTSNREGGIALKNPTCCDDIYQYVYDEFRRFTYKAVFISNDNSLKITAGAVQVYLRDPETSDTNYLKTASIDEHGVVSIEVEKGLDYTLIIESVDHFIASIDIPKKDRKKDFSETDTIILTRLTDQSFVLENIYYDFDDWSLTKKAEQAIDSFLLRILFLNPDIKVEISSHTDAKGSGEYNIKLSQKRAESVVQYLRKKGISSSRMVAKGYGKTKPIAPNTNADGSDNPEGRQLNRRTEFKVIGFEKKVKYKKIPSGNNVR